MTEKMKDAGGTVRFVPRPGVKYARLDAFLAAEFPHISRSRFQKLIAAGGATVNGRPADGGKNRLFGGETVSWKETAASSGAAVPQNIKLDVLHEDGDIIVVDKPAGIVVHPACGHADGTVLNALAWMASRSRKKWKPFLVHRLDKDTTGILVAAKNERAKESLTAQFKARSVEKTYIAVVRGETDFKKAVIDAPLGRSPSNRFVAEVGAGAGKESYTEIELVSGGNKTSVFLVKPRTGRTHQIRAHFAYIGHPIMGDVLYGGASPDAARPLLHAFRIAFLHPSERRGRVSFESPPPPDISAYIKGLKL